MAASHFRYVLDRSRDSPVQSCDFHVFPDRTCRNLVEIYVSDHSRETGVHVELSPLEICLPRLPEGDRGSL
jgi:hypothetical protein